MSKLLHQHIFICPTCQSNQLAFGTDSIRCQNCQAHYSIEGQQYIFEALPPSAIADACDQFKYRFKRYARFYSFVTRFISPVFDDRHTRRFLEQYVRHTQDVIALNLGSGNSDISDKVSNVDIVAYPNVDVVCRLERLPFADNSIDITINLAVLEHLPCPEKAIGEMYRVLKKGGIIYSFFPFIQGFHASPHDFSRRTKDGLKLLHHEFETIEIRNACGPTSGFLWVFQEWVAIVGSFGYKPLYHIILYCAMLLTFPLKFFDVFLLHHPMAQQISSGFFYIGKKT